jgi:GNAT superfamily N-acetyltransferase
MTLRTAVAADAEPCGHIAYHAFRQIAERHGFPPDFPSPEVASGLLSMLFSHPKFFTVVAEVEGTIVGSNALDERGAISGIGPITIDPTSQNSGIGRALMDAVIERAAHSTPAGVRLVQAAYHNRSLSLYLKLGFDVREPLSVMNGELKPRSIPGYEVTPATDADVEQCNLLCAACHGHDRGEELADGIRSGSAVVVRRAGRISGYASGFGFFGHAVGEANEDVQALLASAKSFVGPGILVPTRNSALMRWCFNNGLRVVFPATLMSKGLFQEPRAAWLPSILY